MITQITTPFSILQDEWVMLAPLGDHPHELGIQRFTPQFIQNMANRFNGFFAKLGRLFSGAPTFEGHHDIEPDKYPNSRSYGWIMSLEARVDGLWGRMTWTPEGREMLQNGAFKFVSPVFIGKPISQQNGQTIFEPIAFKSLALTNEPNLPLPPLANQKDNMQTITEILGLNADANADQILEAARSLRARNETLTNQLSTRGSEMATLQNTVAAHNSQLATARTDLANAITRADAAQMRLIGMILDNAIRESRITLAQRDHWKTELEKDFAAAETALANQQPALNTESKTRELGNQKYAYDTAAGRQAALTAYIGEQMANGLSYDDAWQRAKTEKAEVFVQMKANRS
jgi:phage I-like protein